MVMVDVVTPPPLRNIQAMYLKMNIQKGKFSTRNTKNITYKIKLHTFSVLSFRSFRLRLFYLHFIVNFLTIKLKNNDRCYIAYY